MNLYSYFKPLLHSDEDSTLSMQPGLDESASDSVNLTEDISSYLIAKPLGEAGNRGARSRNAFVCMYVCIYIYIYIYIYPSQSTIVTSIDCAIGKMAHPIRQNLLGQRKQVLIDKYARQTTPYEFFFTLSHLVVPVVHRHRSCISILMLTLNYNTVTLARLVAAFQCMPFWDSENRC